MVLLGGLVASLECRWSSRGTQHCGIPHKLRQTIYSTHSLSLFTHTHTDIQLTQASGVFHACTRNLASHTHRNNIMYQRRYLQLCLFPRHKLTHTAHTDQPGKMSTCEAVHNARFMESVQLARNKILVCGSHI